MGYKSYSLIKLRNNTASRLRCQSCNGGTGRQRRNFLDLQVLEGSL